MNFALLAALLLGGGGGERRLLREFENLRELENIVHGIPGLTAAQQASLLRSLLDLMRDLVSRSGASHQILPLLLLLGSPTSLTAPTPSVAPPGIDPNLLLTLLLLRPGHGDWL
jgi:hypothetical protein